MIIFDPYLRFGLLDWSEGKALRGPGLWVWCTYCVRASTQSISHLDPACWRGRASKQKNSNKIFFKKSKKIDFFKLQNLIDLSKPEISEAPI
jgi:hypothetical protein